MSRASTGRRPLTVVLSSMLLMAAILIPPAAITSAASASTMCETFTGEGTYSDCWLDIRSPSSVVAGTTFTVQVAVTTDATKSTVAKSDPCGSKAAITLEITGGDEFFDVMTVNANAGIASFTLNLSTPGDYDLFASGPGGSDASLAAASSADCSNYFYANDHFGPLMVVSLPPGAHIAPCPPDTNCVQTTSGATQATLIATQGASTWTPKGTVGSPPYWSDVTGVRCGTSTPSGDPFGVLNYALTTTDGSSGVIILAIDPRDKGVGQFNVCWTQTAPFRTITGALATTGDLPNCKNRDQVAPCVLARTGGQGGHVAYLTILATANDPDPAAYGH
jgi:hypothetical protein